MPFTPPFPTRHIHFIGICGKAMRGVAEAMSQLSIRVTGSDDHVYGEAAEWLERRGIQFRRGFSASALDPAPDVVVIGRAHGRGNIEVETVLERRLRYFSLPRFLADFFLGNGRNLVVAGSKGKTTTTAMSAWILECAGLNPGYLIAGNARNLPAQARLGAHDLNVLEGDDYSSLWYDDNPKFCYYRPETVIVTNILEDHPDQHRDASAATRHFDCLVNQLPRTGLLVLGHDNAASREVRRKAYCPAVRVGFDEAADSVIEDWVQNDAGIEFRLEGFPFALPLYSRMNALNAAMAAVAARHFGVALEVSAEALRQFRGVRDRLEMLGVANDIICYTDMGYLPESMEFTFEALRTLHPGSRLVLFYQPHIIEGMSQTHPPLIEALVACDLVLITDVYRPVSFPATNPGFSDELHQKLQLRGIESARIGPIANAAAEAVQHLRPNDVVVGIIHPKHGRELQNLAGTLAAETAPCAS